jgi:hypothetical protein
MEEKHANQTAKIRGTLYHIHVLPPLNHRGWKQPILKTAYLCKASVQGYSAHYAIKVLICGSDKGSS